jgi:hypothetical protein
MKALDVQHITCVEGMKQQQHRPYLETLDKQQTYAILPYFIFVDECATSVIVLLNQRLVLLRQGFIFQEHQFVIPLRVEDL